MSTVEQTRTHLGVTVLREDEHRTGICVVAVLQGLAHGQSVEGIGREVGSVNIVQGEIRHKLRSPQLIWQIRETTVEWL